MKTNTYILSFYLHVYQLKQEVKNIQNILDNSKQIINSIYCICYDWIILTPCIAFYKDAY